MQLTEEEKREYLYGRLAIALPDKQPTHTPTSLDELNLEKELISQYGKIKQLMDDVIYDETTPPNQRATVANSVASTLGQLIKLQEDLQKGEQLKLMESCLIEALKLLPQETKDEFFVEYERLAKKAGLI